MIGTDLINSLAIVLRHRAISVAEKRGYFAPTMRLR
jgi:hypothetical protein